MLRNIDGDFNSPFANALQQTSICFEEFSR